ncbi:oxidoreductase [Spartinivicinus ruber]|uniref:oxidoreductase n=1 Tax=Spartinivicinus ruber TaxID=2683272 RepID=UPI0013D7BF0C|nr:oxidoreductase [Spartinivicinus ruber]
MQIPDASNTTVNAIYQHYEKNADSGFRAHLGASIIGKECQRALWYDFHWCTPSNHSGQLLRLFETGQLAEARFAENLRAIGVQIHTVDPKTGLQYRVVACDGHFGGSMDGIGQGFPEAPKTPHVVEMKTHSEKSFKELEKKKVKESKPQHYTQMQVYMHLGGFERAFYIAVNKNTDELYGERVEYDQQHAREAIDKACNVIFSSAPPAKINEDPSWFKCKFCDHQAVCHQNKLPPVNCRTCMHSTPVANGQWLCERYQLNPTDEQQRWGCQSHMYNPHLLYPWAEVLDSGDYWYQFAIKATGEIITTGEAPEHHKSSELRAVSDLSLLNDKNVEAIREHFDAKVVA